VRLVQLVPGLGMLGHISSGYVRLYQVITGPVPLGQFSMPCPFESGKMWLFILCQVIPD